MEAGRLNTIVTMDIHEGHCNTVVDTWVYGSPLSQTMTPLIHLHVMVALAWYSIFTSTAHYECLFSIEK